MLVVPRPKRGSAGTRPLPATSRGYLPPQGEKNIAFGFVISTAPFSAAVQSGLPGAACSALPQLKGPCPRREGFHPSPRLSAPARDARRPDVLLLRRDQLG